MSFWNCLYLNSGLKVRVQYEPLDDGGIGIRYYSHRNPTPAEFAESREVIAEILRWKGGSLKDPPADQPIVDVK